MAELNDLPETPPNPHDEPGGPQAPPETPPVEPAGPPPRESNPDARMWAMFAHLAGLAGYSVLPVLGWVVGPLVVWLLKRDTSPFVDEQGKEAVNFQITILIYAFISALLMIICIGVVLLPMVIIVDIVLIIIAAIKANDGYHYRYPYPLIIRFIK